jgi:hypothetical protein
MPNWKKVITSGSDAELKSLNVSNAVTASDVSISEWGSVSSSLSTLSEPNLKLFANETNIRFLAPYDYYNGTNGATVALITGSVGNGLSHIADANAVYDYVNPISSSIASDIAGLSGASGNYAVIDSGGSSNRLAIWTNGVRIKGDSDFKILTTPGQGISYDQWDATSPDVLSVPALKTNGLELGDNLATGSAAPFTASLTIHANHGNTSTAVEKTTNGHQYTAGTHVIYKKGCSSAHINYTLSEGTAHRSGQLAIVVYGNEAAMTEYSTIDIGTGSTSAAQFSATAAGDELTLSITSAGGNVLFSAERMYSI